MDPAFEDPAMLHALGDVEDSGGVVPREVVDAFAVGVVGEYVPEAIDVEVVGVAETIGEYFSVFTIRADAYECAADGIFDG